MARTACGKNGNTADPSFHGHSTLHPVAGNGLGGLLCSAGAPDLVAAECLSLRNISTGKRNNPPVFYGSPGARSADWPVNCPTCFHSSPKGIFSVFRGVHEDSQEEP